MKGGVTYKDMEARKRKAAAFDEALAYLESHADNEASVVAREILRAAMVETQGASAVNTPLHNAPNTKD